MSGKFSFKFSNLLGAVYRKGNLNFSKDGDTVISPVGNRVSMFDLKNNKSETLPIEAKTNVTCVAMAPDGKTMIVADEQGRAMLISLISRSVLHHHHFHAAVRSIKYSPDGKKVAVNKDNVTLVYHAPGQTKEFNPFKLYRSYHGPYDETTCIDWTSDSRAMVIGSKDMTSRVHAATDLTNLLVHTLGGHKDVIVGAFFEQDSLDAYTVSRDGTLIVWESTFDLEDLQEGEPQRKRRRNISEGAEEERNKEQTEPDDEATEWLKYKKTAKHYFQKEGHLDKLTSVDYHKGSHIMVTGFQSGSFHLHELPEYNCVHSLSISDQSIATVTFNPSGDWIAVGCSGLGQLLVWEWQSESYVLKQQGHFNNMSCLDYSPDGQYIATGADDSKVKVWSTSSGFCFVTFTDHAAAITAVKFGSTGHVIVSASLDGTVRAFDLHRYRNFRTFTSPRPAQFRCLAFDGSGDVVCAGSMDTFEIFVWSMKTGRLLEVLAGHEGPVVSLSFSPSEAILASASWDKSMKLWDVFEHKGARESFNMNADALCVAYRPDSREVAVATLNCHITFWDVYSGTQTGSIEGRHDLGSGRRETDYITAKTALKGKAFTTLCYSADGQCILAAGRSKHICIYNIKEQILVKKFEISHNLSLDAMEEFLSKRKMTSFGSTALIDDVDDDEEQALSLPGVRKGDMSSRSFKPEICVTSVKFSPTGRSWAATTTEGLLVYSLDSSMTFDPYDLTTDVTPDAIRRALFKKEYASALMLSFKLNEKDLIQEVVETIPPSEVELISQNLHESYVDRMLGFLATQLETSRHIEFYLQWSVQLLSLHGSPLKSRSGAIMSLLTNLQKSLSRRKDDLAKLCDSNKYTLQYILSMSQQKPVKRKADEIGDSDSDDDKLELHSLMSDSD
ncbi:periodic tryptophan protein 2 homolog [Ptychodera flava]|uniref:periodic tryptophan protein 2 homolog n=1 Tax=Ptychodera flava TaxID=63121 RepID=UPI00396A1029